MKKKLRSLISLLAAFALFSLAVPAKAATSEDSSEAEDVVLEEEVGDVESSDDDFVEEDTIPDVVYEDVVDDVYSNVPDEVYGDIPDDVYGDIPDDVYGEIPEDVYEEDIIDDVYGEYPDDDWYDDIIDDVYGKNPDDVTLDVYNDRIYEFDGVRPINKKGEVILDYTNKKSNEYKFTFFKEAFDIAKKDIKNIVIQLDNLKLSIPANLLKDKVVAELTITKKNYEGALSTVYDFTIKLGDKEFLTNFKENPIILYFKVDPSKVKDWDNIRVVYIDDKGNKKEYLKPKSYNKKTGEVVAEVTHFSSYGVFEVENSKDDGNKNETGNKEENKDGGTPVNGDQNNKGQNNSNSSNQSNTDGGGKKLPNTATNHYNLLILGLLFMMGSGLLLVSQKGIKLLKQ